MHKLFKLTAFTTLTALVLGLFGSTLSTPAFATTGDSVVTIQKYIDGAMANAVTASSSDFQMQANFTIASSTGSGQYALSAAGYNGDPTPYQAKTSVLPAGSDYATNEIIDGIVVGATNSSSTPFSLVGYTTGDTLAAAVAATPTMTSPSFTNITSDKYVIVWNKRYVEPIATSTATTTEVKVTIDKFVNGAQATASSSNSQDFPMSATYNSAETGPGTGTYNLSAAGYNGDTTPYRAKTIDFTQGADYSTNEILTGTTVSATCTSSTTPYALVGYTTGNTKAEAMAASSTMTTPTFTNLTSDKYVIVWNKSCTNPAGTIGGDVSGGVATSSQGTLEVTSITPIKTSATANGTYTDGWKYMFNITVPNNETHLSMKFADWMNTTGSSTIPAANNMRISSSQADNGGATVPVTAANTYTVPTLNMVTDMNPSLVGTQVQVLVEVSIPSTTVNGSYTTNYGVKTN